MLPENSKNCKEIRGTNKIQRRSQVNTLTLSIVHNKKDILKPVRTV